MQVIIEREFTDIVKSQLNERGWSLRELARQANIAHPTLSNYFTGKKTPGADQMEKILAAFGLVPHLSVSKAENNLIPTA